MFISHVTTPVCRRAVQFWSLLAVVFAGIAPVEAGFHINATYDSSINSLWNATQVKGVINSAIAFYESKLTDNITVNITFQNMTSGLGQSQKPIYTVSYTNYLNALTKDAATANDTTALANLPVQYLDPVTNQSQMYISQANLKALGFKTASGSDGTIGLNTSQTFTSTSTVRSDKYDLYAVVCHEIDEVLGLGSAVGFNGILPEDLYRYDANGQRSFTTASSAAAYFSINGTLARARFNQNSSGDYGDWYSSGPHQPQVQDAFGTQGVIIPRTMANELLALDVIGYNVGATNTTTVSGLSGATYYGMRISHETLAVPEPCSLVMTVLGCLGFGGCAIRRNRRIA